ncbi:MAG: hypothetical protein CMK89_11775 [Pseudomonadales bacterium]|nr:hypothetical protein [Pseudomonadales bacterium]
MSFSFHNAFINLTKRAYLVCLLAGCMVWGSAYAVTQSQINSSASSVKQLKQEVANTEATIRSQEKNLWSLDKQILDKRKEVREERTEERKLFHEAKRQLKLQTFEIERIEKDLSLVDFDIDIVRRDMERDQQRHAALNVLKQRLAQSDYESRQREYQKQIADLETKKQPLIAELETAKAKLSGLQQQLDAQKDDVDDNSMDADPRISSLIIKRDSTARELNNLRSQLKSQQAKLLKANDKFNRLVTQFKQEQNAQQSAQAKTPAPKPVTPAPKVSLDGEYASYVFVVSGDQEPNIESTLHLKSWVESYGAKYIEANWNGFGQGTGPNNNLGFQEAFRDYIRQIPQNSKVLLIGHGLGGGAAIEAATRVAYSENRTIDFLAVLDPMGSEGLRANIVYDTKGACTKPEPGNTMTNAEYVACIKSSKKRAITSNIKYFYNRWQKDAQGPLDYQRQIASIDARGNVVSVPTASGRFSIANGTEADQRRVYFAGDKDAHKLLLAEEAKVLPKLLVQHLR